MKQERTHRSYTQQKDYQLILDIYQEQKEAFNTVLIQMRKYHIDPGVLIYFETENVHLSDNNLKYADPVKCISFGNNGIDFKHTDFDWYLKVLSDRKLYNALKTINDSQMISYSLFVPQDETTNGELSAFILDKDYFEQENQVVYAYFGNIDINYGIILEDNWRLSIDGDNVKEWPFIEFIPEWVYY